jgi:acetylornithine deacetylase/succinyl-diaminopimelate desuccinylase-like protein
VEAVVRSGLPLHKPVLVAGTVLEEPGGEIGVRELVEGDGLRPDWAIVGACSGLDVYIGHRGVVNVRITTLGTSVHASTPEQGVSALESMAQVILASERWRRELPADPVLGPSVLTMNHLTVVPNATNVRPERCVAVANVRNVPALAPDDVVAFVDRRLSDLAADPRFRYEVSLARRQVTTWLGAVAESRRCMQGALIAPDHPLVAAMRGRPLRPRRRARPGLLDRRHRRRLPLLQRRCPLSWLRPRRPTGRHHQHRPRPRGRPPGCRAVLRRRHRHPLRGATERLKAADAARAAFPTPRGDWRSLAAPPRH